MNETTKALLALLLADNSDEMVVMLKATDSIEAFAVSVKDYVEGPLMEEVDWNEIAQHFAELPFDT